MTPQTFETAGRALFRDEWKAPLARALGNDERTIRRWAKGDAPIPPTVAAEIIELVRERIAALEDQANTIDLKIERFNNLIWMLERD